MWISCRGKVDTYIAWPSTSAQWQHLKSMTNKRKLHEISKLEDELHKDLENAETHEEQRDVYESFANAVGAVLASKSTGEDDD